MRTLFHGFVSVKPFLAALATLGRLTPNRFLPHVTLDSGPDGAFLVARIGTAVLRLRAHGIRTEGVAVIPMQVIGSILKATKGAEASFTQDESGDFPVFRVVTVEPKGRRATYNLKTLPTAEAPEAERVEAESFWYLACEDLRTALDRVKPCVGDSTRYSLDGALMECRETSLTLVACDGARLAHQPMISRCLGRATLPFPSEGPDAYFPILPESAFKVLSDISKSSEEVQVCFSEKDNPKGYPARTRWVHFRFLDTDTELSIRLVDGRFPDYASVFPESIESRAEFGFADLSRAVKLAMSVATPESRGADIRADDIGSDSWLTVSAQSADAGATSTQIDAYVSGQPFALTLDPKQVLEILKPFGAKFSGRVRLGVLDAKSAMVWSIGDGFRCVMMPLVRDDPSPDPDPTPDPETPRDDFREAAAPVALAAGQGAIGIGGTTYAAERFAGPDGLRVVRLTKRDGTVYDVAERPDGSAGCDCPDYRVRREGIDRGGCKHVKACAALGWVANSPRPLDMPSLVALACASGEGPAAFVVACYAVGRGESVDTEACGVVYDGPGLALAIAELRADPSDGGPDGPGPRSGFSGESGLTISEKGGAIRGRTRECLLFAAQWADMAEAVGNHWTARSYAGPEWELIREAESGVRLCHKQQVNQLPPWLRGTTPLI